MFHGNRKTFYAVLIFFQSEVKQESVQQVRNESEKKENVQTSHTEFGGAFGTFLLMFFLPATLYYMNMACSKVIADNYITVNQIAY